MGRPAQDAARRPLVWPRLRVRRHKASGGRGQAQGATTDKPLRLSDLIADSRRRLRLASRPNGHNQDFGEATCQRIAPRPLGRKKSERAFFPRGSEPSLERQVIALLLTVDSQSDTSQAPPPARCVSFRPSSGPGAMRLSATVFPPRCVRFRPSRFTGRAIRLLSCCTGASPSLCEPILESQPRDFLEIAPIGREQKGVAGQRDCRNFQITRGNSNHGRLK